MKTCICCGGNKDEDEFYDHPKMADGKLNKCKSCCKNQSTVRYNNLIKTNGFLESERKRRREKYRRYKKREKATAKEWIKNNPEKMRAKHSAQRIKKVNNTNQNHHWSYRNEHTKDVIELSTSDHVRLHRGMVYDKKEKMYRTISGTLLNSKQSHIDLLKQIKNSQLKTKKMKKTISKIAVACMLLIAFMASSCNNYQHSPSHEVMWSQDKKDSVVYVRYYDNASNNWIQYYMLYNLFFSHYNSGGYTAVNNYYTVHKSDFSNTSKYSSYSTFSRTSPKAYSSPSYSSPSHSTPSGSSYSSPSRSSSSSSYSSPSRSYSSPSRSYSSPSRSYSSPSRSYSSPSRGK